MRGRRFNFTRIHIEFCFILADFERKNFKTKNQGVSV